ncbi:MAG: hypothetical protein JKX97_00470 [Candidatus Lindowbacteria bacterium]|nr:hypothetical protein [Candidatus Lindowbacteria bacterium]
MLRKNFPKWFALTLSQDGRRNLVDVAFLALCYLMCAASPLVAARAYSESPSQLDVIKLQRKLRKCQREWDRDEETCMGWAMQLEAIRQDIALAVVTGLSHFDASDASMHAPDVNSSMDRYADIDMHVEMENRTKTMDKKTRAEPASSSVSSSSSSDVDMMQAEVKQVVASGVDPERFLVLAARTVMCADEHMRVISGHRMLPRWTHGDKLSRQHLDTLLKYEITSASSRALSNLYMLRCLPMGARSAALRYSHGNWSTLSSQALMCEELTNDECQAIGVLNAGTPKKAFAVCKESGWAPIHDAWALIMWERMVKTDLGVSFLNQYVVQSFQLLQHASRWSNRKQQARLRDPVIVEVCGQWFLSTVDYAGDGLCLTPCGTLMCAIQAWALAMRSQPRGCVSVTGHRWERVIDAVLTE